MGDQMGFFILSHVMAPDWRSNPNESISEPIVTPCAFQYSVDWHDLGRSGILAHP